MITALRNVSIAGLAAGLLAVFLPINLASAEVSCDPSAATGKPQPAPSSSGDADSFRIFWQVATQIEDLADAAGQPRAMKDVNEARKIADGYYVNALLGGPMMYWPGRPQQCALNFKRIEEGDEVEVEGQTYSFDEGGQAGREQCLTEQKKFLESRSSSRNPARDVQLAAIERAVANLDLRGEQQRGKPIWGATIIRSTDFTYDNDADKVALKELPHTYCVMNGNGITLNGMMIYQETGQKRKNKFLWIPRLNRRGELVYSKNPRLDKIPANTHAVKLIAESFRDAGVPAEGFRANLRRWNSRRSPEMAEELSAIPGFGGFNFEGGSRIITNEARYINNFVEGIAWILANTDRDVSLLMPGYWTRDKLGSTAEIDELIPRLRKTLLDLNRKLSSKMALPNGQNAVCSNRLTFIVASYGQPIHVKTLPMRRESGELAGTVTGQIKLLSEIRKKLCG